MPKPVDMGHYAADQQLNALERRLASAYVRAGIELRGKIENYLKEFEKVDAEKRALYDSGELSHEDYMKWRFRTLAGTKQWKRMRDQLANDLAHQNEIAASMINDTLPGVYAENHNYGTFSIERESGLDTSYTLYSRDTVYELLQDNKQLLPRPRVNIPKDQQWNAQHIQSEVLQGILQGESMDGIADRLRNVTDMSARAAIRNARTAVTGAENAGRLDSMERAVSLGVELQKMWLATRDSRTRDGHVLLDGEQVDPDETFSNGCRFPGDPLGEPSEVYNCRCTMRSKVKGANPYSPDLSRNKRLDGMSYEEWKAKHNENSNTSVGTQTRTVTVTDFGIIDNIKSDENRAIEKALSSGKTSEEICHEIVSNHESLANYTPQSMKENLEKLGINVIPLNKGNYKGVPFEEGGGYRVHFGGDGIFQYHPEKRSHHGGAYWKVKNGKEEHRYAMDGNEK